jgi:hypothetical protein
MRARNPSLHDPYELVLVVAGFLYVTGHYPIQLDERALSRAIPAAGDLLRALGITPINTQSRQDG